MYVVTAAPAEVDPGEVVSIPFCFYKKAYSPDDYWSSFARGIDERFFDTWTEERCQQFQDVEYCIDFSGLSATLEWDPDVLTLLEARLRPRTIASEMTLEIVDSSPGLLEIQVSGGTGFHVYDTVFELDFLASSIPQLTSIASSSTGTYGSSGGFSGFVDRAATPAWIRIGCEKGDVVDDDVLDDSDAQAVLDLLSGTMPMDDFAYCRADFDFDGEASPGDAVLMLREIDGLGDGAGSSMSCVDGTSILPWGTIGVEGAAGLELYLQYPDGSSLLSTSATHGLVSAQEIEPGIAKLVWATSNLGGVAFLPVFDVEVECMIDLDRSRAFDETGAEIPLGDFLLTDAPSSRWRTILRTPHPNPFNPRTTIAFELAESGGVKVEIVDARGRRIRRLFVGDLEQGPHELVWDGRDDAGASAASGVYRVLLQTPEGVRSRPAVLLK
jgi:hypothetical protein